MQSLLSDGSSATISTEVRRETVTSDEGNLSHQRLSVCKASKHDRDIQDPQEPQENHPLGRRLLGLDPWPNDMGSTVR